MPDSDLWAFGTDEFTIEFWANFDQPASGTISHPGDVFISHDEGPFTVNKWFFAFSSSGLEFHVNGPGVGSFFAPIAPFAPTPGQWQHLAVTERRRPTASTPTASCSRRTPMRPSFPIRRRP